MNKNNELLKDLINELDKIYQKYGDEVKVKNLLESIGYKIRLFSDHHWGVDLTNNKTLELVFSDNPLKDRYFNIGIHKQSDISESDINPSEKSSIYHQTYMTNKNGINKLLTYQIKGNKIYKKKDKNTPKDILWKNIIERERANNQQIEHHLILNPKVENYRPETLLNVFRDTLVRFYRRNDILGKNYHKRKEQQMMIYIVVEYGDLFDISGIKETHFHILLKSDTNEMLEKFHPFMREKLQQRIGEDINYEYRPIDTAEYRINVYNYLSKEDRTVWTNNDLYKPQSERIPESELDDYDKIIQKICHTTNYDEVFRQRAEETRQVWENIHAQTL